MSEHMQQLRLMADELRKLLPGAAVQEALDHVRVPLLTEGERCLEALVFVGGDGYQGQSTQLRRGWRSPMRPTLAEALADAIASARDYEASRVARIAERGAVVRYLRRALADAEAAAEMDAHDLARARAMCAALPHPGIGDVWGAIIEELPEGPARDAAIARRALGIERYGCPLRMRDLETVRRDRREEQADACAYSAEEAALLWADGDEEAAFLATYVAAESLARASGEDNAQIGYAIGRAVRGLAKLKRGGA